MARTERDLSFVTVIVGSSAWSLVLVVLPQIPGESVLQKLLVALLVIVFGFIFVTVSSRIVGIIGSSSNPISGMTIATLMATAHGLRRRGLDRRAPTSRWRSSSAAWSASPPPTRGATSQDLKTGYLVGATPRYQQIALFVGAIASAFVIGFTVKVLDTPTAELPRRGSSTRSAPRSSRRPQGTLMATLIKGLLSLNLDWHFVLVGAFFAVTMELCGVKSLSFAVGLYLPLSTTLPIFVGGALKGVADWLRGAEGRARRRRASSAAAACSPPASSRAARSPA